MSPAILRTVLGLLLLVGGFSSAAVADDDNLWDHAPYSLGRGLDFPRLGLNVGGYLNLHFSDLEQQEGKIGARDLSLFVSKNIPDRWQLFAEVAIEDALEFSRHGINDHDSDIDLERLYADYRAAQALTFRFGKFLTPVGHWNLIHADPLVWTADRPLTTAAPFPRHATGAMLYGDIALGRNSLDYSLYGDDSDLLDPAQKREQAFEDDVSGLSPRNAFKRAAGGRAAYHFMDDSAFVGASYLRAELQSLREQKDLFGIDALWTINRMEFSGEWVYRHSLGAAEADERGGFVQAVFPLPAHLYLIGRSERYRSSIQPLTATINTAGITYRPDVAVTVKLEHRDGIDNDIAAPSGWLGSLAILF